MNPNTTQSDELREKRSGWLIDLLHYAIQFHVYAEASREDVAKIVDSLSDSDEYDDNVAALVQMPRWCGQSEAQEAVDRHFAVRTLTESTTPTDQSDALTSEDAARECLRAILDDDLGFPAIASTVAGTFRDAGGQKAIARLIRFAHQSAKTEGEPSGPHCATCGGNGFSGGKEVANPEWEDACEECNGTGLAALSLPASTPENQ